MSNDWLKELNKKFEREDVIDCVKNRIKTQILPLNYILSGSYDGGFPVGRIVEIYGAESSGKTALATMAIAETQKMGGLGVFLDYEHSFEINRAHKFGLVSDDPNRWYFHQPKTAEDGCSIIELLADKYCKENPERMVTIVVDSVANMTPKSIIETSFDGLNMKTNLGVPAFMSSVLPKLNPIIHRSNICLIFINQLRDNVGVMYGPKEKTTGGRALKFYATTRLKLSKVSQIKGENDGVTGDLIRATVEKNKAYRPWLNCTYSSSYEYGIDLVDTHVNFADELGILGNTKGWVEYNGSKMRRKELSEQMRQDKDKYDEFINFILNSGVEYE